MLRPTLTLLATLALVTAACDGDDGYPTNPPRDSTPPPPPPPPPAPPVAVSVQDNSFSPASVTIFAGRTVTWTNTGAQVHNVTAENGAFASGSLDAASQGYAGGSFSYVFSQIGTFRYNCTLHAGMSGTVTVTAAPMP